ncbi:galanin peptides-like [Pleurodeles waltl]|uniref:galanin peptides-like n=1 Tax=Pleurodeles waltl TaxID=8319 RepID=UPI003709646A
MSQRLTAQDEREAVRGSRIFASKIRGPLPEPDFKISLFPSIFSIQSKITFYELYSLTFISICCLHRRLEIRATMKNTTALLCVSLVFCGFVTECFGFTLMPKDKRGWTLNSAGYLLGPHAHRTLTDKGGPSGKREALDDLHKPGFDIYSPQLHSMDEDSLQMILEFLSFLRLKEVGALDHLSLPVSSEESSQT